MAVLKKGSKGSDVKKLQAALNKLGARPKLAVDGDFGPKTDAAVRTFQKGAALKVDGQVGPLTQAAIKAGGKLPEMTVQDYSKRLAGMRDTRLSNLESTRDLAVIVSAAHSLFSTVERNVTAAIKIIHENQKHWDMAEKLSKEIVAKQAKFAKLRLTDPKQAEKLVRECEALDAKVTAISKGKIKPNIKKASPFLQRTFSAVNNGCSTMQSLLGDITRRLTS